jgi:hypothetical protein
MWETRSFAASLSSPGAVHDHPQSTREAWISRSAGGESMNAMPLRLVLQRGLTNPLAFGA